MVDRIKSPRRPPAANHPPFDAVADISKAAIFIDDFVSAVTGDSGNFTLTDVVGTGSVAVETAASIVQGHPGVVTVSSGATSGNSSNFATANADAVVLPDEEANGDSVYVAALINLASVTDLDVYFGLFDDDAAAGRGQNAVALEFDTATAAFWQPFVADGGAVTAPTLATGEQVAATVGWTLLEVVAHEDECSFYVDRVFVASVPGVNIPDDEGLNAVLKVGTNAAGAAAVSVDAVVVRQVADRLS